MNRKITGTLVFLAIMVVTCQGRVAADTNTLTPEEVSNGWILLFDGETKFGWFPRGDAQWKVDDEKLVPFGGRGMLSTTTDFADYELKVDVWIDNEANSGLFQRCPIIGEITQDNAYEVNIFDAHNMWPTGSINGIAKSKFHVKSVGKWTTFDVLMLGDKLAVKVDGKTTVDVTDAKYRRGTVALQYNGTGNVRFRNIKLKPLNLQPIFNGVDLTGWKVLPGHPSVYSVTPEGWLNVKNGSGDIQSEKMFRDFVLQLDIISNGDHLNSGVFFRASPGDFWSGYESQIRNQWQDSDRTMPVDFGTGGIYGLQPARRVIPRDHEWFTKTIVAHGSHFAVWVNGYQVSDFADDRPPNANARQGFKSDPGVISLQGHDPTTDLSFRNIVVVEMPARMP